MAEKPPFGYNKRDKPLPHHFVYQWGLDLTAATKDSFLATYMRTSKNSSDPATIEVNNRNTNFVVDIGPLICEESIVQKMTIAKTTTMTKLARVTDNLHAITVMNGMMKGVFADTWSPADELTTTKIEDIVEVTDEATNMDVVPKHTGTDLSDEGDQPLSNVTATEVFGDYNLTTNANLEGVDFNLKTYRDALRYYTIAGKLRTVMPFLKRRILTYRMPSFTSFQTKFIPKQFRFGRRDLFIGELFHQPLFNTADQISNTFVSPTAGGHVDYTSEIWVFQMETNE